MRILHLSMLYPPHILGGAERSVAMLAEQTAAMGHDVAAACISPAGEPRAQRNGVTVYRMPHETSFWPEEWPKHSKPVRAWSKFKQQFNYALQNHFLDVIDDFKPDIVHTHSLVDVSTLTWRAAKKRGLKIVHTLRDYDLVCANSSLFHRGQRCTSRHLKCQAMTFTKRFDQKCVDAVAGVGAEILERHLQMGAFTHVPPSRRRVIWNPAMVEGAGPDYQKPPRIGAPFTFGYLGRINIEKGVATVLRACQRLPADGWRLLIAGKANDRLEPFLEMADGMPVEFAGFMDPKAFFESIDVLLAPSIWAEPLPRTILESYAMGVPALGARSGGIPDLIGHANDQWLFEPDNDQELTARMLQLMRQDRSELPTRADFADVLTRTTPTAVAENYLSFYREAINDTHSG